MSSPVRGSSAGRQVQVVQRQFLPVLARTPARRPPAGSAGCAGSCGTRRSGSCASMMPSLLVGSSASTSPRGLDDQRLPAHGRHRAVRREGDVRHGRVDVVIPGGGLHVVRGEQRRRAEHDLDAAHGEGGEHERIQLHRADGDVAVLGLQHRELGLDAVARAEPVPHVLDGRGGDLLARRQAGDVPGLPVLLGDAALAVEHRVDAEDVARPVVVPRVAAEDDVRVAVPGEGAQALGLGARDRDGELQLLVPRAGGVAGEGKLVEQQEVRFGARGAGLLHQGRHLLQVGLQPRLDAGRLLQVLHAVLDHLDDDGVLLERLARDRCRPAGRAPAGSRAPASRSAAGASPGPLAGLQPAASETATRANRQDRSWGCMDVPPGSWARAIPRESITRLPGLGVRAPSAVSKRPVAPLSTSSRVSW